MFAWLNGSYLFGARAGGTAVLGEYTLNLGDLNPGTYFLQLLLEDHGGTNGYNVLITADTFIPGPPPSAVPIPAAGFLLVSALGAAFGARRFARRHRTVQR